MNEYKENKLIQDMPALEVLLASIYYLMTRHARLPDPKISEAIIQHLEMLEAHPDCESKILTEAGKRLALQWREYLQAPQCVTELCGPSPLATAPSKLH